MIVKEKKDLKMIPHNIQVGSNENPLWRCWGYSVELNFLDYKFSDSCDFCKIDSGIFFKTVCHCGSSNDKPYKGNYNINSSFSPEHGDFTFYCCEKCVKKLTKLIQEQNANLLNHEILDSVITILKAD